MASIQAVFLCVIVLVYFHTGQSQHHNPTIIQDSRLEPKVDGTFGFMYRTEDGIAHAAKGDPDGQIHGRFSYTDPTGLKVNFNYNAGSRVAPGYKYDDNLDNGQYNPSNQRYNSQVQPSQLQREIPQSKYYTVPSNNPRKYSNPISEHLPQKSHYNPLPSQPNYLEQSSAYDIRSRPPHLKERNTYANYDYQERYQQEPVENFENFVPRKY